MKYLFLAIFLFFLACFAAAERGPIPVPVGEVRTHKVLMGKKYRFYPDILNIKKGDKVIWTNTTRIQHNVESVERKYFRSKYLRKNQTFEFTFEKEGTFEYFCRPHKKLGMKGTIIVGTK